MMRWRVSPTAFAPHLIVLLTMLLAAFALASPLAAYGTESSSEADSPEAEEVDVYEEPLSPTAPTVSTFIDEEFYDGTVKSPEDALKAVESVIERIGGDETTKLELVTERPVEDGTTYYTFRQQAGDIVVYGASVKLIVDKDGKAIGLVSSVLPDVKAPDKDSWEVSQEQAEEVVRKELAAEGVAGVDVIDGATEQTLIPIAELNQHYQYVWVVYTPNYFTEVDRGYVAHYVDADGYYLYCTPVSEPGDFEALLGKSADFNFDAMTKDTWTGTVTLVDGTEQDLSVPVLVNPDTGDMYLADAERKVLCADYPSFRFDNEIVPIVADDDGFYATDVLEYNTYLRVWDFYDSIGWTGPDDMGTPTLMLMNYVDSEGEPTTNAMYLTLCDGWQTFAITRVGEYGECTDIIAHEFTHCVTTQTMTDNLYRNDYGAINEAMSDILGNLVEMLIDDNPEGAWLHGEKQGSGEPDRSMKDPNKYFQPAYTGDAYYVPGVSTPSNMNDNGGVHTNSSLLNRVSYELYEAGMSPEDQFYYWMNVALAITPRTDYPQLAELLPWCMEHAGYPQYVEALKTAVDKAGIATTQAPDSLPDSCGAVTLDFPDKELADAGDICLCFMADGSSTEISTWPGIGSTMMKAILPAGEYQMYFAISDSSAEVSQLYWYDADGWHQVEADSTDFGENITVKAGETLELSNKGLG